MLKGSRQNCIRILGNKRMLYAFEVYCHFMCILIRRKLANWRLLSVKDFFSYVILRNPFREQYNCDHLHISVRSAEIIKRLRFREVAIDHVYQFSDKRFAQPCPKQILCIAKKKLDAESRRIGLQKIFYFTQKNCTLR